MTGGTMEGTFKPKLLASTEEKFSCSINEFRRGERDTEKKVDDEETTVPSSNEPEGDVTNFFKSMQWYKTPTHSLLLFSRHGKVFSDDMSNIILGRPMALVFSQTALTISLALSSPQQISSPRTLPHLLLHRTHLCTPLSRSTH
jgi:hypothetical protein